MSSPYSPPTSPSTSPTPTRIPKPKGNRLTKSPNPNNAKREKSPARGKSPDRRTSLQVNTSGTASTTPRRLSLGSRSGKQPTTPTINISFASSGSISGPTGLTSLSSAASASNTSFPTAAASSDSPNSTSTHLPLSSRTSPHTSWIPGAPYMPGSNATTLAAITPSAQAQGQPFPASLSESNLNLIPPQGLMGPLLTRESILRTRERERAASMGMPTSTMSAGQAGQLHGLLEASGLLPPDEGRPRGRFDSVTSSSTWTTREPTRHGNSVEETPSNASSVQIASVGQDARDEEEEAWFRREGMLDGMSSMHETYEGSIQGDRTLSSSDLAQQPQYSNGHLPEMENNPTPRPSSPASPSPAPAAAKLSKSASLRSTLPSIRSFRNPFSFSRSASTSGATTAKEREQSKEREKSKERSKSKERATVLPIGNRNHSGSNISLSVPSRHVYTPISQRTPTTPTAVTAAAAFAAQVQAQGQVVLQVQTPPRPSGDTMIPGAHARLHGASPSLSQTPTQAQPQAPLPWPSPSPAVTGRFGFSGRAATAGRHSMDSPVGYSYGRLGTMFAGAGIAPSPNGSIGRLPVQAGYANGSRERVALDQAQLQQSSTQPPPLAYGLGHGHGHPTSLGGVGRASPAAGRASPAFSNGGGGTGITGLVRPPGLDSHQELDERSLRTERTESGYGFGGIQVGGDGIMLSPVDDTDEGFESEEEEEEVRALLSSGVFEGEYESTEGHAAPPSLGTHGVPDHHAMPDRNYLDDETVQDHATVNFSKPSRKPEPVEQASSYPYPTSYPEDVSPDTSGETTSPNGPRLPPGLEHLFKQAEVEYGCESPSDSVAERDLLGELARQLQRVVEQQSTTTLASKASQLHAPQTPSSVLQFGSSGSSQGHGHTGTGAAEDPDEFGRWSVGDLKGAVERMKALIDEQEKRTRIPGQPGHSRSKNSISLNDTPPPVPDVSLGSEDSERYISFSDNGQSTPRRRISNPTLLDEAAKRKASQSSSSATTASTALVTPVTPHDGPSFPLPTMKSGSGHERMESFDLASLDADLLAMLSPNHMTTNESGESGERRNTILDDNFGISIASSGLLPSISTMSTPTRERDVFESGTDSTHLPGPVRSAPMREDLTIATVASDGFGSMRSDRSVEEILLQRSFDYDPTEVEEERPSSMILEALALEPASTSSPPRKKVHTPRASSVSTLPSAKMESREKPSSTLFPVIEGSGTPSELSPSKSSPSRSPLSKIRVKDRPPLPQFDSDPSLLDGSVPSRTGRISPSPSPVPPSRAQQALGHGRRPPSRTSGNGDLSSLDRMRRVTGGSEVHRSLNQDDSRHHRLQSIAGSHSDTPISRIGLDLGPRTARAFAAAGVLDGGPSSAPSSRVATWRSASVMGYRRDGVERDFGTASGARSLASSPIPMLGAPGASGAAARRLAVHDRELYRGADFPRTRAISDAWSRPIFSRTPETALQKLNIGGSTDPSGTSSPTSTAPPRTTLSSSTSSNLPAFEIKGYRSSSAAAESNASIHQAAMDTLKERHELEKEALLSALGEAKKESRVERAAKEELALEVTEMGVYVEELETKLGEALARMRWMEKEIGILKDAVGVAKRDSPAKSAIRQSIENKRLKRVSSPAPSSQHDDNVFGSHFANNRDSPLRTQIIINHVPASPNEHEESRHFPVYEEDQSPLRNRGHRRISSDASSIAVPRVDQSMSMLLQENGYADGYDETSLYSANEGSPPPSPTMVIGKLAPRSESSQTSAAGNGRLLAAGANQRSFGLQTPSRGRKNQPPSTIMEMSPTTTTADYSFNPGSPGSLVLRPEDEHHLGDLLSLMGSDDGL